MRILGHGGSSRSARRSGHLELLFVAALGILAAFLGVGAARGRRGASAPVPPERDPEPTPAARHPALAGLGSGLVCVAVVLALAASTAVTYADPASEQPPAPPADQATATTSVEAPAADPAPATPEAPPEDTPPVTPEPPVEPPATEPPATTGEPASETPPSPDADDAAPTADDGTPGAPQVPVPPAAPEAGPAPPAAGQDVRPPRSQTPLDRTLARAREVAPSPMVRTRPNPQGDFETACRNQPQSEACRDFLAPRACGPENPFLVFPFTCQAVLEVNPCWEDPDSNSCQVFLVQPCFAAPRGPACLEFITTVANALRDSGDVPCVTFARPPAEMSPACRLWTATFNDFCEVEPEICDEPFGGSREALAFAEDPATGGGGGGGDNGGSGANPGGRDDDDGNGGGNGDDELKDVDPGASGDLGTSNRGGDADGGSEGGIPFTGLGLLAMALVGAALVGGGFALRLAAGARTSRRRGVLVVGLMLTAVLLMAGQAQAYSLHDDNLRWAFDTITYHVDPAGIDGAQQSAIKRGVAGWNKADIGWRFEEIGDPDEADVVLSTSLTAARDRCRGSSQYGFGFRQRTVLLYGRCFDVGLLTLGAAHEIGHVLGLNDQHGSCSIMNTSFRRRAPNTRPAECPSGRDYLSSPVQDDDRRGALALYEQRFRAPARLCSPSGELPIYGDDLLCKYSYDCTATDGHNTSGGGIVLKEVFVCPNELRVGRSAAARRRARRRRAARKRAARRRARVEESGTLYTGATSQGGAVDHRVTPGYVRRFRIGVEFSCTDGYQRPNPYQKEGLIDDDPPLTNVEFLGPFPKLERGVSGGLSEVLFDPAKFATYTLEGEPLGDEFWLGTFRIVEHYSERPTPYGFTDISPDPDGPITCDTGEVEWITQRAAAASRARRFRPGSWRSKAFRRLLRRRSARSRP